MRYARSLWLPLLLVSLSLSLLNFLVVAKIGVAGKGEEEEKRRQQNVSGRKDISGQVREKHKNVFQMFSFFHI